MMQSADPFDLDRFVRAQQDDYGRALAELRQGHKRSHWMWYVFPQVAGLGESAMSVRYAIGGLGEAQAYLDHSVLGARLQECADTLLNLATDDPVSVLGSIDARKLRSSMTLFAQSSAPDSVFHRVLGKYFGGVPDERTLEIVRELGGAAARQ